MEVLHHAILAAVLVIQPVFPPAPASPHVSSSSKIRAAAVEQNEDPLKRGQELISAGRLKEAVSILQKFLRENPLNPDAHLLLGTALSLIPRRAESLAELRRAIELRPDFAPAYNTLGMVLGRFGETALAREALEKALELDPQFIEARLNLVLVLANVGEFTLAGEHLDQILKSLGDKPTAAYPHYLRGAIHNEQNNPQQAVLHFEKAVELQPSYVEAYLKLGLTRKRLADTRRSIEALHKALHFDPANFEAHYRLGLAYLQMGDPEKALEHLQQAAHLNSDDLGVLYSLVRTLRRLGRLEQASKAEEKLLQSRGQLDKIRENALKASQLNNEGVELEKAGRLQEAIGKYEAALELDPFHGGFRRNLGLALCRLGRWDDGIEELQEILRKNPDDQETRRALYIAIDQAEAARTKPGKSAGPPG